MNKEKTVLQQLLEWLNEPNGTSPVDDGVFIFGNMTDLDKKIKELVLQEQTQIENAYIAGVKSTIDDYREIFPLQYKSPKDYYNKTYGKE
jgi:hypothetical protein